MVASSRALDILTAFMQRPGYRQYLREKLLRLLGAPNPRSANLRYLFTVDPEARALSQNRWRGDESDAGLTWGTMMSGDPFVDVLASRVAWNEATRVVEIGPGYGRILDAILRRGLPFCQYTGLELSSARVLRLRGQYRDLRLSFIEADVLGSIKLNENADLVFGAAVFEHFYPDFGTALRTISGLLAQDGAVVFDLIREPEIGNTTFEANGTFIRWYTRQEAEEILRRHDYHLRSAIEISYGLDVANREIVRTAFVATKGLTPPL